MPPKKKPENNGESDTQPHIKHRSRVLTAEGWRRSQEKLRRAQTEKQKSATKKK